MAKAKVKKVSNKGLSSLQAVNESHAAAIDEYYLNGFNGGKAVMDTKGSDVMANARVKWSYIIGHEGNKNYIETKRAELRRKTDIHNEQVLRELIQWAYIDATDFIELEPHQVKELPPDVRRCIQSFESKVHNYTDRHGDSHTEKIIKVKLIDKIKAIEMVNKHIGFYEADNKQKANKLNLTNLPDATINILLDAMKQEE